MSFNMCEVLIAPSTLNEVLLASVVPSFLALKPLSILVNRIRRIPDGIIGMTVLVGQRFSGRVVAAFGWAMWNAPC